MDNSDLRQKILVRQKALKLIPSPNKIIDMYAGEGFISKYLWSKLNSQLICIDKERKKINKIDFAKTIVGDNNNYIDLTKNADIVDLDAYGLVIKTLKKVLDVSENTKVICFTESNPFNKSVYSIISQILEMNIHSFWIEKSHSSNVYYGFIYYCI